MRILLESGIQQGDFFMKRHRLRIMARMVKNMINGTIYHAVPEMPGSANIQRPRQ